MVPLSLSPRHYLGLIRHETVVRIAGSLTGGRRPDPTKSTERGPVLPNRLFQIIRVRVVFPSVKDSAHRFGSPDIWINLSVSLQLAESRNKLLFSLWIPPERFSRLSLCHIQYKYPRVRNSIGQVGGTCGTWPDEPPVRHKLRAVHVFYVNGPDPTTEHVKVEFRLPKIERDELDKIAYEESEPGDRVSRSDVLREASRQLIESYENDENGVDPQENGNLETEVSTE